MIVLRLLFLIYLTNAIYLYFERDSYDIFVSESTQIHTKISLIKAISSPSLSIEYELHGDTNKTFDLNSLTGELILFNYLDYEIIPIYKFTIEARSSSIIEPCFSELIIHILNINDNPPEMNLIIYPSILYESDIIKYDLNTSSTPFATINIKDLDESTKNLSLSLNDTEHFQIQLIRQMKNSLIYILSTKTNPQLIDQDYFYLSLNTCDNDQPLLCTNQTYKFHLKSNEYLCHLSFNQKNYIIDIKENLSQQTLLMHKITNKFCQNMIYSIDDTENFYIDSHTGDLFTLKEFHRIERSIYIIHLFINNQMKIKIMVRIMDQYGNIPFLINKNLVIDDNKFIFAHLYNSTQCRSQSMIENYFQLLSNCTIIPLIRPPKGQYLFSIELNQRLNYQDTFLLELQEEQVEQRTIPFTQSQWIILISIILSVLSVIGIIIGGIIIIKQKRYKFNQLCRNKQQASSLSIDDESHYNRYDVVSTLSKLKVHDDHELSSSPTSTAIYVIEKPSSLTSAREDEGYSGSSDVSDNHLPYESTIISANELLEQYRIHDFYNHQSISSLYDVPRRYIGRMDTTEISLV